jgi:hypothetical protein
MMNHEKKGDIDGYEDKQQSSFLLGLALYD